VFGTRRTHVGIYVDDAPGPLARATAVVPHLRSQATVLSCADLTDLPLGDALRVRLPGPGEGAPARPLLTADRPTLGLAGAARLVAWMQQEEPDLLVVDGPSDVALFARLCGVPIVVLRRHGRRNDVERQLIDRSALGLLAPYPLELEPDSTPAWVRSRTVHVGFVSSFADRRGSRARARRRLGVDGDDRIVVVVAGKDGLGVPSSALAEAAAATESWRWYVLGASGHDLPERPDNLHQLGWVSDTWPFLAAADVVISGASYSTISEVACLGVPSMVVPRPSEDREERRLADLLAAAGAAVPIASWPTADAWPATLSAAADMCARSLADLDDGRGAQRAADWLDAWAATPIAARADGHQARTDVLDPDGDDPRVQVSHP
jgi:UDP-N-acetylglucosamine:LPS N-acetylglucosamine transferase